MKNITPTQQSGLTTKNQDLAPIKVQTPNGLTQVQWDNSQATTPLGQLVFFAQYLECSGLFSELVADAPLDYNSNNAPAVKDVLGTLALSILSGHKRYSNMGQLYGDEVSAEILGLNKICSDDSARRGVKRMKIDKALPWLDKHLRLSWEPMLDRPWIADIDATVKPVFGKQESAAIGYNPVRPGRPSYSVHSYFIANARITLGVEVRPGNEHAGSFALPGLFRLIDSLSKDKHPYLIRGDVSYGSEKMMLQCESRDIGYLFKLRMSTKVRGLTKELEKLSGVWEDAGQGWEAQKSVLQLQGWEKPRKVVVMRYKSKSTSGKGVRKIAVNNEEPLLFPEVIDESLAKYRYSVLVTSLDDSVMTTAQMYRDRGDCENNYDEYKNQWGWGGFTSQDFNSTKIMASLIALISNWWNIYARLAIPEKHSEAISSRPLLLEAVGRLVQHGRQRLIRLSTNNASAQKIALATKIIADFLSDLTAAQSNSRVRWLAIVRRAFIFFEMKEAATMTATANLSH